MFIDDFVWKNCVYYILYCGLCGDSALESIYKIGIKVLVKLLHLQLVVDKPQELRLGWGKLGSANVSNKSITMPWI